MAEQSAVSWVVVVFNLLQRSEVYPLFLFDLFLRESRFIEYIYNHSLGSSCYLFPQLLALFAHYCEVTW